MPTLEQLHALAEAPASVLLVLLVALILIGAIRKWWVPGWLYDQAREDNRILRDQTDRSAKAIEALVVAAKRDRVRKVP